MIYVSDAFSLSMVPGNHREIDVLAYTANELAYVLKTRFPLVKSIIGDADIAQVVSSILGVDLPCNRENITLNRDDVLFMVQTAGGKLSNDATTLPKGVKITFRDGTILPEEVKITFKRVLVD